MKLGHMMGLEGCGFPLFARNLYMFTWTLKKHLGIPPPPKKKKKMAHMYREWYRGLAKLGVDEKMVVEWLGEGGHLMGSEGRGLA